MNLERDIEQLEERMEQVRLTGILSSQAEIPGAYAVQLRLKQIARLLQPLVWRPVARLERLRDRQAR